MEQAAGGRQRPFIGIVLWQGVPVLVMGDTFVTVT